MSERETVVELPFAADCCPWVVEAANSGTIDSSRWGGGWLQRARAGRGGAYGGSAGATPVGLNSRGSEGV
jgi:hypothetical protein